jgi:predicted acyl esterase
VFYEGRKATLVTAGLARDVVPGEMSHQGFNRKLSMNGGKSQHRLLPSLDTCEANSAVDSRAMQLAWMEFWFKDKKSTFVDHPVILYVMGENRWRAEESWPLAGTGESHAITQFLHTLVLKWTN